MIQELLLTLGIEDWKPIAAALLLPPVPFLLLAVVGARLMFNRRLLAWLLVLLAVTGIWLSACTGMARLLLNGLLHPPLTLSAQQIADLKRAPKTAIVVLGAGRKILAPEWGVATLKPRGIERLRYGLWLARETGLPVAFSGGVGLGAEPGPTEADIAARIAERDFGRPLRWLETHSRDTRENALQTVALLQPQGIEQIVVVTHADHMPRALANFERATAGTKMRLVAAPMGGPDGRPARLVNWLPGPTGYEETWIVLHEWLGRLAGA